MMSDAKLKEILIRQNYVVKEDMENIEHLAKTRNISIYDCLITEDIITKDLIGQAIAESFGVSYADLNSNQPSKKQILKIPEAMAKKLRIVLFKENKNEIIIATDNPDQSQLLMELQTIFPEQNLIIAYSVSEDIDASFANYQKSLEARLSYIITNQKRIAPEIVEQILSDALSCHASDIHFEPQSHNLIIRFRIDGVLQDIAIIPREHYENILNHIKIKSRMRTDEHFTAQDGSMRYERGVTITDIRASIVPTTEGEKIVLRILSAYIKTLTLTDLGLSHNNQNILERVVKKPFGMVLIAGPTGSGKTTTLYAILKILNQRDVNITTIEDPVEYKVLGINQVQVNTQTNLTFARGLRSIVRQDPDIILVGEVRDQETAEIAVNAALTGHMLFSTFHANDASTAIPRLLDMNIEPFLLASTLEVIIAQRLVRKICDQCRYSENISQHDLRILSKVTSDLSDMQHITLYKGKGCDNCGYTGYKGRTAVFEFIPVTLEIQNLILKRPSAQEIWKLARQQGAVSLFEDGMDKVKNGITTIAEIIRVVEEPDVL